MPFDSKGKFTRNQNWEQDRLDDIDIVTEHHDDEDDNFADGLSQTFLRNGLVPMEGNLNVGNFRIRNLLSAALDGDAVNFGQLKEVVAEKISEALNKSLMVGDIKESALQADHNGWLLCNGRALSRTSEDYAPLFAQIGTAFGAGDGSTTFNIPDCRGVVTRGLDNGRGLDAGRTLGSYQEDASPNITGNVNHAIGAYSDTGILSANGVFVKTQKTTSSYHGLDDQVLSETNYHEVNLNASRANAAYGRANEVRVKNIALNKFIKAKDY